jgi:hypothetical protein
MWTVSSRGTLICRGNSSNKVRIRYLHRKIRAGETADLVNVLINKAKYIRWFDV